MIWEDILPEIIDPRPARCCLMDGSEGEGLHHADQGSAAVIRYRTRDLTRLLPPTARMRRMGRSSAATTC